MELMTEEEHQLVDDIGHIWDKICKVVGRGPARDLDLTEAMVHIHALQQFVMSQAAARAYPDKYRKLGDPGVVYKDPNVETR